jgi:hypothetical protein
MKKDIFGLKTGGRFNLFLLKNNNNCHLLLSIRRSNPVRLTDLSGLEQFMGDNQSAHKFSNCFNNVLHLQPENIKKIS